MESRGTAEGRQREGGQVGQREEAWAAGIEGRPPNAGGGRRHQKGHRAEAGPKEEEGEWKPRPSGPDQQAW